MKLNYFKKRLNPKSFLGKLFLSHIIVTFISLSVLGFLMVYLFHNYFFGLKEWEATNNSKRIAELVSENIPGENIQSNVLSATEEKINTIAKTSNMDIGLINQRGEVILTTPTGKSTSHLTLNDNEISYILTGNTYTRKITGPEQMNLLMGAPLKRDGEQITVLDHQSNIENPEMAGAVIIRTPLGGIADTVNRIIHYVLYSFLAALIASIILSISFTKRVTKPLQNIQKSALQTAEGKFKKASVPEKSSNEIKHLADTYNYAINQIKETLEQKKELEKMRKDFVANVSHEFRAPLTSIKGFMEIIKDQELSKKEIDNYIDIMYKDTKYLEHLLADLIELGKLESQKLSLEKEMTHPKYIISSVLESLENKIKEKNIDLDLNLEENLTKINVDPNRIQQVLINLLENAITYSPRGGTITIRIKNKKDIKTNTNSEKKKGKGNANFSKNRQVEFSIIDEGPGIPKKEQKNIWERFYKVERARTREEKNGSGLGLSIVRDIVQKHGGEVNVESTPGEGATFSFIV